MNLKKIKKVELHLHLDGSMKVDSIIDMAEKYDIELPYYDKKNISNYISYSQSDDSLLKYLKKFEYPLKILQYRKNIERTAYELLEDLYNENYLYVEIRFAPHLHLEEGMNLIDVIDSVLVGAEKAKKKFGIEYGIILCIMRHRNIKEGYEIIELAKFYKNKGVVGIDLAGDEKNYSIDIFKEVFKKAVEFDINMTIHAGEADGADSVRKAVMYGAKRIGHGIRAYEDKKLVQELSEKEIVLEICPISNYQTKVIEDFSKYPINFFLENNVKLSLNTDNRTVSNTDLNKEAEFLIKNFHISKKEIYNMLRNSIIYSFVNKEKKKEILEIMNKTLEI